MDLVDLRKQNPIPGGITMSTPKLPPKSKTNIDTLPQQNQVSVPFQNMPGITAPKVDERVMLPPPDITTMMTPPPKSRTVLINSPPKVNMSQKLPLRTPNPSTPNPKQITADDRRIANSEKEYDNFEKIWAEDLKKMGSSKPKKGDDIIIKPTLKWLKNHKVPMKNQILKAKVLGMNATGILKAKATNMYGVEEEYIIDMAQPGTKWVYQKKEDSDEGSEEL